MSNRDIYGEELESHESYGLIRLGRVSCSPPRRLFATPIRSQHYLSITISEGKRIHSMGDTRFWPERQICEIAMSETQFAQLITTPNTGQGVPCTIDYKPDGEFALKRCEQMPEQESPGSITRRHFEEDISEKIDAMKAVRRRIKARLDEARISKKLREELHQELVNLTRLFEDSAPFVMERFEENTQDVVAAAKAEVSSYARLVSEETGVKLLKESENLIE